MLESEQTIRDRAYTGDEIPRRVCSQLLADVPRYALWHSRHERRMNGVSSARLRERQIMALRSVSIEQIHRAALVRYLRDHQIKGAARELTLREFYGVADARDSVIAEHRNYLLAESTQLCAADILDLVGDRRGVQLVRNYELAYGQFFSMFCEQARAARTGHRYLLATLLPEVRESAERARLRILDSQLLPVRPSAGFLAAQTEKARPSAHSPLSR
jgi:hypothetical protein